jgi:hypothetical protein
MANIFTYDYFCELIQVLKQRYFNFGRFTVNSVSPGNENTSRMGKVVYMRHDIDLNLNYACKLAELECQLGVTSSYFMMLEADTYNLFSPQNRDKARAIISLGHDVGLHFVPPINLSLDELCSRVKQEVEILSYLLGSQVSCFSIHRPAAGILSSEFCPQGLINTYSHNYFAKHKYISDSNHNFRCGDPIKFIEDFQYSSLQILIHPVWWKNKIMSPEKKIYEVIEDCNRSNKYYVTENINLAKNIFYTSDI